MQVIRPLRSIAKIVQNELSLLFLKAFPGQDIVPVLQNQMRQEYDYLCPSAIKLFNMNKKDKKSKQSLGCNSVVQMSNKVCQQLTDKSVIGKLQSNDQGFIRITLASKFIQANVAQLITSNLFLKIDKKCSVVVDFSSPNIAKEMHVGHLRSTIIGQSLCRMLEYVGYDVRRVNHLGDWGTQFGMLISYMNQVHPDFLKQTPQIKDLDQFYKAAKNKFDKDAQFKKKSQETVVKLQALDKDCIQAWKVICQVSRNQFNRVYKRLKITNNQFGQSYYNSMIPSLIKQLDEKKLLVQSDGAMCIFIDKQPLPLMVIKKDGGFNYDTTDLTAIRHRLQDLKADWIVYITDAGQLQHFTLIFQGAKKAGWLTNQRVDHMGFGLVLGSDNKKFSSRKAGGSVKLMDLLDESKQKALNQLKQRQKQCKQVKQLNVKQSKTQQYSRGTNLTPQEYQEAAQKLGMASIKYYDLKQNRITNYVFDYNKMLDPKVYAYVRMCSIIRKSGISSSELRKLSQQGFKISHNQQRKLASSLIKFAQTVFDSIDQLALNRLTDFIYQICVKVQQNYKKYRIIGDQHQKSRLVLCQGVRMVLEKAFFLIGIQPLEKI